MFLHLAPNVLGQLVNRVGNLRGGLASTQRNALETQGRLRDLAVFDGRVALFVNLDVERGKLRDLFADATESLVHVTLQLVRHLDVAPTYLDPHRASFSFDPSIVRRPYTRDNGVFPLCSLSRRMLYRRRVNVIATTRTAPPLRRARAAAPSVDPVVITSSTG